jgi:hypothetical protein
VVISNDGQRRSTLSRCRGGDVFVTSDEFLVKDPVIRVPDNDGASMTVRDVEERHPSRVVERFASNERVLVGQLDVPTSARVAINRHNRGNIGAHKDSIQPSHESSIGTDRGRRSVEDHTANE